jgi:photosystem II stability/assembly factor-like uncharacterized protein
VYRTSDAGLTWTHAANGLAGDVRLCLFCDPDDGDAVYCGTSAGMYKSTDRGSSWFSINTGMLLYPNFNLLSTSPLNPDLVYAVSPGTHFMNRSTDQGSSWVAAGAYTGCGSLSGLAASPYNANDIWAFDGSG